MARRSSASFALLMATGSMAFAVAACVDEGVDPVPSSTSAGGGGSGGQGGSTSSSGGGGTPPLAPESEPEPLPVAAWMRTLTKDLTKGDPVREALEDGTFTLPEQEGQRDDGFWKLVTPDENGGIGVSSTGLIYAAASIDVPADRYLIARGDRVLSLWTDNLAVHPGDIYASGRVRAPLSAGPGSHLLVARALAGSGEPQIQLFTTPDELLFNTADAVLPDLVAGDGSTAYLGVAILNTSDRDAFDVAARVEESDSLAASEVVYPNLPRGALTQVAFELVPKAPFAEAGQTLKVGVRLESTSLQWSYRREIELTTVAAGSTYRRTFLSPSDGSAQYYGVVPPKEPAADKDHPLVLTLHGASVEGIGQAQAYSQKDDTFIIAPTNRRPYGFDWESFGRIDALEVLDDAMARFPIADDRVYLTGHSMGGHGTWNFGILFPGRFATVGPSAGWSSYYSYAGLTKPTGAFARSQAASDTLVYVGNLARRGAYVIHGDADDNVPLSEANLMIDAVSQVTPDVQSHIEPGAGHWWDGEASPGADCVDWPPLFDFMATHTLDPFELDFDFTTPSPAVNPHHSFVTIRSQESAYADSKVTATHTDASVEVVTVNVRSLELDGAALAAKGITTVVVDGASLEVEPKAMLVGPADGKRPGQQGPFDEVFRRPFCFVYADEGPEAYAHYAAYVLSSWQVLGNGRGCALPLSRVTSDVEAKHNLVYLGLSEEELGLDHPTIDWGGDEIVVDGQTFSSAGIAFIVPSGDHLAAVVFATPGSEGLLDRFQPFRSVFAPPDYMVFSKAGVLSAGFFTPDWTGIESP